MERVCDLHTHSNYSDGTCTPVQLMERAKDMGLGAVALCDHNTVDGLPEFLAAARPGGPVAVCGGEFSVDFGGKELHLLGLFIPERAFGELDCLMQDVQSWKTASNRDLCRNLSRAGYAVDYDKIAAETPNGKINRSHIGAELMRLGHVGSIREAFDTLLTPGNGYYNEPTRLDVFKMLEVLTRLQAVPVLAHPFLNLTPEALEAFLPQAKEAGLVGMEVYYSTFTPEQTALAQTLARQNGLLPSGGSDFHGANKPDIQLGTGRGNLRIPMEWAMALASRVDASAEIR